MTTEDHNRTLAILHLVHGGLRTLILLLMMGIFGIMGFSLGLSGGKGAPEVATAMMLFWAVFSIIMLALSIPSFVAGYGALKKRSWAKVWMVIAGAISGMSFPLGTALCVYTFWFLFSNGGKELYEREQFNAYQPGVLHGAPQPADWRARTREYNYAPPPKPPDWRGE